MAEISDYLKDLDEQEVQEESRIQVVQNPVVEEICEKYEQWMNSVTKSKKSLLIGTDDVVLYKRAVRLVNGLSCSAKDIRTFSLLLQKYQDYECFGCSGGFLSALINMSKNDNFEIITNHLEEKVNEIGYELGRANVKVLGDAPGCAKKMYGGSLSVSGNADYAAIMMCQGVLIVKGDMVNAGPIYGGEIRVYGKNCSVDRPVCSTARIYHKKRLRWGSKKDEHR